MVRIHPTSSVALCLGLLVATAGVAHADTVTRTADLGIRSPRPLTQMNGRLIGSGNHMVAGNWGSIPGIASFDLSSLKIDATVASQMAVESLAPANTRNSVYYAGDNGIGRFDADSNSIGRVEESNRGYRSVAIDREDKFLYVVQNVSGFHSHLIKMRASDLQAVQSLTLDPDDPTPDGISFPQVVLDPDGKYAYVLQEPVGALIDDDSSILQVRLSDMSIIATVTLGQDVNYLAITPDGGKIYATSSNELNKIVQPRIYEVSLGSTPAVSRVQNAQGSLGNLAIDSYGRYAYVTQRGPDVVLKYELASLRVRDSIPMPSRPATPAISPDGSTVYVSTDQGLSKISVKPEITGISPSHGSITGTTSVAIKGRYINTSQAQVSVGGVPCLLNNRQPSRDYHCTLRQTDEDVGPANVRVVNPGDQKDVGKDLFTFTKKQYPVGPGCLNPKQFKSRGLIPPGCRTTTAGSTISAAIKIQSIKTVASTVRGDYPSIRLVCRTASGSKASTIGSTNGYVRCGPHQRLALSGLPRNKKLVAKVSLYAPSVHQLKPFRKTLHLTLTT